MTFALRRFFRRPARALAALALVFAVPPVGAAQAPAAWHGDLAAARAFMVDAAKLYELQRKDKVAVKALNTIAALEALARGQIDLVATARPADPKTPAEADLEFTPVAWDALVLVTHPSNPVSGLGLTQLRDVYLGRIADWGALGGTPKPINLYAVAGPLDGVEYSLRKILFGRGDALVAARRWYINTKQLEDGIALDPAGLGVTTLSNVWGNKAVKVLAIEGVAPSLKTLEDGEYLLAAPLYIAARRESSPAGSTVSRARRAFEFFRDEPALRAAWRRKQLVPFTEAKKLAEIAAAREAWIMAHLGIDLTPPKPPGPPMPPAPPKTRVANALAADAPVRAARPAKATAATTEARNRLPSDAALATTVGACRPQPVCA